MVSVIALRTNTLNRDKEPALCGAVRCSTCFILGPLMFLINVSDMPQAVN